MSIYNKLFGKNAEESDSLIASTRTMVRLGKYKEAEETLKKAIKLAPSHARPHRFLGNLYERMHRDQEAIKAYKRAIELAPGEAEYRNQLGTVLFRQDRLEDAEEEFRRAIEVDPTFEDSHANLGALLMKAQKYTEAEQVLRKAILLNPADGHPHRYLSAVLHDTNQLEEAIQELETAIEIYKKDGKINTIQLELTLGEMRAKIKEWAAGSARKAPKPARKHEIEDWNENHSRANGVLHQLYETYTNRSLPDKKKMQQLQVIVDKNRPIIYGLKEFTQLLESEIEKTMTDGPAIMAMQYLEIRWLLTGRDDHRKEIEEYEEKAKGMSFEELTEVDL
jgi:Flp pilus assembly protein TadD